MTYTRLPALARKSEFGYQSGSSEVDPSIKSSRIGRLQSRMVLQGDYQSFRRFIYEVESSPEFLIIDSVTLTQSEADKPLARDARSVDLLPHQDQWQLTARGRSFSVASRSRWRSSSTARGRLRPARRSRRLTDQ